MSGLSIAAVLTWALPLQGNASINVDDTHISLMVQEDEWCEVSDKETLHTFTNGEDVITVLKYGAGQNFPHRQGRTENMKLSTRHTIQRRISLTW